MKNAFPQKAFGSDVVVGWKEIATYLRKGVRTVERYEREMGLPVRRPAGKSVGSVLATKAELDGWIAASPLREVFRLSHGSLDETAIQTRAALRELNRQVAELRQLRKESAELRSALHESRELLRQNLHFQVTEVFPSQRRVPADALSFPSKEAFTTPSLESPVCT